MRSKWYLPATILAALLTAATAPAQDVAYINLLQFDLQSYRSQATAGIFTDDVDNVGDAAKLVEIEGNRLFTNFANLNQPATLGDNILTYSSNNTGSPFFGGSSGDVFDSGSYLVGWIGKYKKDSAYSWETFYQRNSSKIMTEDLEDLVIGPFGLPGSNDAEYSGYVRDTTLDPAGVVTEDETTTWDLTRYDDRNAMNFDFGAARDISEELSVGGRFFWENDQLDIFSEGTVETVQRTPDGGGALQVDSRQVSTYIGPGEEAFKNREIGVSLDAGYHPWENQDINVRLDVFGSTLVNPGGGLGLGQLPSRGVFNPYAAEVGVLVDLRTDTDYTTVDPTDGPTVVNGNALVAAHENSILTTESYLNGSTTAVQSVDDDRSGIGFAAKGEWDREWAGGENRLWLGFSHRGLDIDGTATAVDREISTLWWNAPSSGGADVQATNSIFDAYYTADRSGDMTVSAYEIGTRWNRPMNDNVSVGLGIILTRATQNENYTETFTTVEATRFDDGAGTLGGNELVTTTGDPAFNEEQTEFRLVQTSNVDDETRATTIRLPVGGQFHFKQRWTVNVGAAHTINDVERETNVAFPAGGNGPGTVTFTDYFAPANNTVTLVDDDTDQNHTITDKARENHTTYWYGLSVMITDAAQLDINGVFDTYSSGSGSPNANPSIFDTDFYRSLALSLKYIFW